MPPTTTTGPKGGNARGSEPTKEEKEKNILDGKTEEEGEKTKGKVTQRKERSTRWLGKGKEKTKVGKRERERERER